MSKELYDQNEEYYKAVSELVSSRWDKLFFGTATMSISDNTLKIDNRPVVKLYNSVEIQNGEVILPAEALQELGVQVAFDSKSVILKTKSRSVELVYGESSMNVGGTKKVLRAVASLKNEKPMLPASVIAEQGLGFEVIYEQTDKKITITNKYQMARIIVKFAPGKTPPNITAAKIIAGPDG